MIQSTLIDAQDNFDAAYYVYDEVLSKPFTSLKHATPSQHPNIEHDITYHKKIVYHPHHGLLTMLIKMKLIPALIKFHHFTLEEAVIENIQRMILFSEIPKGCALEYLKYCQTRQVYPNEQELYQDTFLLANAFDKINVYKIKTAMLKKGWEIPDSHHLKILLLEEVNDYAHMGLYITEQPLEKSFYSFLLKNITNYKAWLAFIQYMSKLFYLTGLHKKPFMPSNENKIKRMISQITKEEQFILNKSYEVELQEFYIKALKYYCAFLKVGPDKAKLQHYQAMAKKAQNESSEKIRQFFQEKEHFPLLQVTNILNHLQELINLHCGHYDKKIFRFCNKIEGKSFTELDVLLAFQTLGNKASPNFDQVYQQMLMLPRHRGFANFNPAAEYNLNEK